MGKGISLVPKHWRCSVSPCTHIYTGLKLCCCHCTPLINHRGFTRRLKHILEKKEENEQRHTERQEELCCHQTQTASNSIIFSSAVWERRNPEQCFGFLVKLLGKHLETCSGFGTLQGGRPRPQRCVGSKNSENTFAWDLKKGPQRAGSNHTPWHSVATHAKKTPILGSLYGEIRGWLLRLQGCCRECFAELCAQLSWEFPWVRKPLSRAQCCQGSPGCCSHPLPWAVALLSASTGTTKTLGIARRHHSTTLSRGRNQTQWGTSPVCIQPSSASSLHMCSSHLH